MQGVTGDLSAKCRVPANPVPCPAGPALANKWGGIAWVPSCGCEKRHTYLLKQHKFVTFCMTGGTSHRGGQGWLLLGAPGESSPRLGSFWKHLSAWARGSSSHVKARHSDLCFHRHVSSSGSDPSLPLTRTLVMTWGPPVSSRVTPQLRILH